MRLAWVTDLHIDHLNNFEVTPSSKDVIKSLSDCNADAMAICGDITTAHWILSSLASIDVSVKFPVYFVLGNHDYYGNSIKDVRKSVSNLSRTAIRVKYLHAQSRPIRLTENTCIIGCDGWGDSLNGDYENTRVRMTDFQSIQELCWLPYDILRKQLITFGEESANKIHGLLTLAVKKYDKIVMVTHVPPYIGASWHEGKHSTVDYLPFFTCAAVGRVLDEIMSQHTNKNLTVLCGHTHSGGKFVKGNISVLTGKAAYGVITEPEILEVL